MRNLVPIVLGLFLLAAFLRVDFYFNIVYLLAGVYLLSRVWTNQVKRHLSVERRFVNRSFPGEAVPVTLTVRNKSWLPIPWLELHDSLPVEAISPPFYREVVTLGAGKERRLEYTLTSYKRGYYLIGPLRLQTGDLLGVSPTLALEIKAEYLIVYPRVAPLQKLSLPTHSPLVALPAGLPLFEDPARIMGVRTYRQGDSPRRIHWPASAGAGALLVKCYQPAIARETLICLDMARESYEGKRVYDATELAIVTAASIANHIVVHEGLAVGLSTQAWDPLLGDTARLFLPPRRERAHLMGILEILARAQPHGAASARADGRGSAPLPFPDFLRRETINLAWGATVVVITGQQSEALFDALVYLRRVGLAVALILVMPNPLPHELQNRADALNFPVYRVWREEDVEAV